MRLRCNVCGVSISSEVPDGTILRAWAECPECVGKEKEIKVLKKLMFDNDVKALQENKTKMVFLFNDELEARAFMTSDKKLIPVEITIGDRTIMNVRTLGGE